MSRHPLRIRRFRGQRSLGCLLVFVLIVGACGAALPVSLVQQPHACDYYHAAQRRFDALVTSMQQDLQSGDPVAAVLRYETAIAEAADLLPVGDDADQVPLVLVSSYKEYLIALKFARDGDAELPRRYAETFVLVIQASAGAAAGGC